MNKKNILNGTHNEDNTLISKSLIWNELAISGIQKKRYVKVLLLFNVCVCKIYSACPSLYSYTQNLFCRIRILNNICIFVWRLKSMNEILRFSLIVLTRYLNKHCHQKLLSLVIWFPYNTVNSQIQTTSMTNSYDYE